MNESPLVRRAANPREGFTLVEVVIALAIFVFGALAIIRIFPPALGVIQNSGDRLVGSNMNRSLLARYEKEPYMIPDGIYDDVTQRAPAAWNNTVGSVAGNRRNNSLPYEVPVGYDKSALGHYKNIVGERHLVPTNGVIYTQFPILSAPVPGPATSMALNAYAEDALIGATVDKTGTVSIASAKLASDGTTAYTAVATGDLLYVSYGWTENKRFSKTDEERLNTSTMKVVQAARLVSPGVEIVPGEIAVRLRRKLALPALNATDAPVPDLGKINLNSLVTPGTLKVGSKVSFDYTVKDWRWLVYDATPNVGSDSVNPTPAPLERDVNLPIRILDAENSPNFYTSYPMQSTTNNTTDSTSTVYQPFTTINKNARIPFLTSATATDAPTARVVYRTADQWAQQLSVAANHYTQFYDGLTTGADPWRECIVSTTGPFIYFHPSEAGKTLLLSYSYGPSTGSANADTKVDGQMLTIDTDIIDKQPSDVPNAFFNPEKGLARLQLVNNVGDPLPNLVTAIRQIDGISVQSRTAWIDGTRFTQVSATRFRGGTGQ